MHFLALPFPPFHQARTWRKASSSPLAYVKGLIGFSIIVGFEGVKNLLIGEEATADRWVVLGWLAVVVEEVKLVGLAGGGGA